ncbi:MAG: hypothetical protein ACKVG4_08710 [Longimicrobiales bacterium]
MKSTVSFPCPVGVRVELLVADIVFPDLTGFELDLGARERLQNLVTVFITGYVDTVATIRLPENATILEKPFSPEFLTYTVRRVLDERTRISA